MFHNGQWGKVCSNNWGNLEAAVVCKELNCGTPKKSQEVFGFGDNALRGYLSRCSRNVNSISECSWEEYLGRCDGASVECTGKTKKSILFYSYDCFLM